MKDQGRRKLLSASMFVIVAAAALGAGVMFAKNAASERQRTFQFTYQVHVPATAESKGDKRLWIPLPQIDEHQSIRKLSIESRVTHKVGREQEYGNSYAVFTPTQEQSTAGYDISLQFEVTRQESVRDFKATDRKMPQATEATMQRYLQPDKMVPLNATIAELARTQTAGATEPIEKAHRIYNYVAFTMRYDKSGEGWGRGDENGPAIRSAETARIFIRC